MITDDLVAVIDGSTDKSGRDYDGTTGGALAAKTVAAALTTAGATDPRTALAMVTEALAELRRDWNIAPDDLLAPSAVAAVLVPSRRLAWRVGDVHIAHHHHDGWRVAAADKAIDRVVASARAAMLRIRLAAGDSIAQLLADDVGRRMMLPVLEQQNGLANTRTDTELGFGVLDGRTIPDRYLEVFDLDGAQEAVLASDGYLAPAASLAAAEEKLATDLAADPLRIGKHAATKAPPPGAESFDDRTFVRVGLCSKDDHA